MYKSLLSLNNRIINSQRKNSAVFVSTYPTNSFSHTSRSLLSKSFIDKDKKKTSIISPSSHTKWQTFDDETDDELDNQTNLLDSCLETMSREEKEALIEKVKTQLSISKTTGEVRRPSLHQLWLLGVYHGLPFIGFGFLDNFIMIIAGDYIDHSIGVTLSISTMAAAAFGNTISDVFGVGSAWYVEHFAHKLGFRSPSLTKDQLHLTSSRIAANMGRGLGVIFGCILGMIGLFV